ncbi:MAG: phosphatidylserine decarboxylase [Opitutales bacterium]|nr:phosphatidylserine decarboxylase [Opitutales bacterium]
MDTGKNKPCESAPPRSSREPIIVFNRETGQYETEVVYGEGWLRWAYGAAPGRLSVWAIAKRAWFSRWYGLRMSTLRSRERIAPFIERYGVDAAEFAKSPGEYSSFNDFFTRSLKPECRPVDPNPRAFVFPADARHLGFQDIAAADGVYAKGQRLDIAALLGAVSGEAPGRAAVVISRLCPVDYHRFHFAAGGFTGEARFISGDLFSVSPIALRRSLDYLLDNKRVVTEIEHPVLGRHWQVEIGATNVGSIVQTYKPGGDASKGAEKGYFAFGGSCVVTVLPAERVALAADLLRHSAEGNELYARMGTPMAALLP